MAAAVRFSVVAVERGVAGRVSIGGWGGPDDSPDHITLRYGEIFDEAAVQVTTYPVEPWEPLEDLVGGAYGGLWQIEPTRRRRVAELAETPRDTGTTEQPNARFVVRKSTVPERLAQRDAEKRRLATMPATRTDLEMQLDDTSVTALAFGDSELWAAAFTTRTQGEALTALLRGRGVATDSIALKLITNVVGELTAR